MTKDKEARAEPLSSRFPSSPRLRRDETASQGEVVYRRWPLPSLRGFISFLDCVGFAHVLALLGRAVKTRAFLVINVCFGVDPDEPVPAARCRSRSTSGRSGTCWG